jgi:hypothetical protein
MRIGCCGRCLDGTCCSHLMAPVIASSTQTTDH